AGGFMVSTTVAGMGAEQYWTSAYQALSYQDVIQGLTKPVIFGVILSLVGCYFGLTTEGGTEGVGRSTTRAVVYASVLILVADFFITKILLNSLYP
ncbi:MAG: ABC transporter permease, partial [Acidobacteriota bacterium]